MSTYVLYFSFIVSSTTWLVIEVFVDPFDSILRESDVQTSQKYMDWFGMNLHIFVIKLKPTQTEKQLVSLSWVDRYISHKCAKIFSKNI